MATTQDWLEAQAERTVTRQRSRVDTAKLIATFAAGVAGSLVASALQTGTAGSGWDWISALALAVTVLLTVAVVVLDRLTEPDHSKVLNAAAAAGLTDAQTLVQLRVEAVTASYVNEDVVKQVGKALWLQLTGAVFTGGVAAYSMLSGGV